MQNTVLLVDMDEVLFDFIGDAVALHGYTREDYDHKQQAANNTWNACEVLGITANEFWQPIHQLGEAFWVNLQPLPWMKELVLLLNATGEWHIVSSPSQHVGSHTGKLKCIHQHLPTQLPNTWINKNKFMLAKNGRWLLDDRYQNILDFKEEGGHGLLFPSYGNSLYQHASNPLPYVEHMLREKGLLK